MRTEDLGYLAGRDAAIENPKAFRIAPSGTPDWQRGWRIGFRETVVALCHA